MKRRLFAITLLSLAACAHAPVVRFDASQAPLTLQKPALYPETIAYDAKRDRFLVGSFREGGIYAVDSHGQVTRIVDDARLCSVLGIALDPVRGHIWAVSSDLGACLRPSAQGPKRHAAVAVYDASTGAARAYVDLAGLAPGAHLANGLALDAAGNAYVSDSLAPVIYKVDVEGHASVFLRNDAFVGEGINLNGLVVHPHGYLLAVKKSDGSLFRIPLHDPEQFSQVRVTERFVGGDGLVLVGERELVVVANQTPSAASNAAFALFSEDDWASARLRGVEKLGEVYPTTAAVRDGVLYVLSSKLGELIQAPPEQKSALQVEATIRPIARVQ